MSENENASHNAAYLIALLRSLFEGSEPPALPDGCQPEELLRLAEPHCVAGMAYYAVERLPEIGLETSVKWRQIRDKALVTDLTQQMDLVVIGRAFSDAGIRYLPLKGSVIKPLYPKSDMRAMSDIDLLTDRESAEKARGIMSELGYSCERFGEDGPDIYCKPPMMNVEIHYALFGEDCKEFQEVFADPWRLCTADGMKFSFTPDAFFAYVLAQAVKRLEEGSAGIRQIMDLWACLQSDMGISLKRSLDMLKPSGKRDTAALMAALSEVWFGGRAHTEATLRLESRILGISAVETSAEISIKRSGKPGNLARLVFPAFADMQELYPILKKAPVLLPACWLLRLVTKPFSDHRRNSENPKMLTKK